MKKINGELIYYILSGGSTFFNATMFTVLQIYYFTRVGLNPLQMVLVGTVLESTCLIFEIPTGIVADAYSRRLSVILGMFILGIGFVVTGIFPTFAFVLFAQVICGIGYTFLSGATDAWLASETSEANLGKIYVRSGQVNRLLGIVGTLNSVALASIALSLPILLGGILYFCLGIFLSLKMPEQGFKPIPQDERTAWRTMWKIMHDGAQVVRQSPTLILLLVVSLISGAASEGFDRLGDAHLLANFTFPQLGVLKPVIWFGIINISSNLFSVFTTVVLGKRIEKVSQNGLATVRALFLLNILTVMSIVTFGLAGNFYLAGISLLVNGALTALSFPLYNTFLIQQIDPKVRATVLSMISQGNALGQIGGGPAVGAVGNRFSIRSAIVVSGLLISPTAFVYARISRVQSRINNQLLNNFRK